MLVAGYARARGYEVLAEPELIDERRFECEMCPFMEDGQCQVCTCLIEAKIALNTESCPKRKWSRVWIKKGTV